MKRIYLRMFNANAVPDHVFSLVMSNQMDDAAFAKLNEAFPLLTWDQEHLPGLEINQEIIDDEI